MNSRHLKWVVPLLLVGCGTCYDPSKDDAAPLNQAVPWERPITTCDNKKFGMAPGELSANMPLTKLLDIALFNNPRTMVSWQSARAAAFGLRASYAPFYPTATFAVTLENEDSSVGAVEGVNISTTSSGASAGTLGPVVSTLTSELLFSYLLLDFGGRQAQVELAGSALFAANWQHNLDIQTVILSVLNAYTSYLGNQSLVAANQQDVRDADVAVQAATLMQTAGLVTQTDVLQAKANKAQKVLNLIQSEGAEDTSLGQLAVALGLPPDTLFSVEQLPQRLPIVDIEGSITELFELAKKRRPDLGIALAAIKQQEAELAISFSSGMPQLNTFATLNYTHFIGPSILDGHDNTVILELTGPIFQGFFYVNQQKQIKAQIAQAVASLNLQVSQVALDLITSYYALRTAIEQIPTAEQLLAFSERAYYSIVAQYKVGTSTIVDMLNALTVLSDARAALVVARTNWALSRANLAFAVGILDDIGPRWNSELEKSNIVEKLPMKAGKE